MRKDIIKSLIAIKQSEIPFDVIDRDTKLPLARKKIITVPGGDIVEISDLSPSGHEYLANIRSDNIWNKTKKLLVK